MGCPNLLAHFARGWGFGLLYSEGDPYSNWGRRSRQDREFERLGGVHTLHVDLRIISATNGDLHQDIGDKKFREDLFYRLSVFPIDLPSRRQRRTDIPILVHLFVQAFGAHPQQFLLQVKRQFANLVQKQCPLVRQLNTSDLLVDGTGKRSLFHVPRVHSPTIRPEPRRNLA
jgi:hypothetical protein